MREAARSGSVLRAAGAADDESEVLTSAEAAAWLKVPLATVYGWASRGVGPRRSRVGRYTRYRKTDLEAFLDSRAVGK